MTLHVIEYLYQFFAEYIYLLSLGRYFEDFYEPVERVIKLLMVFLIRFLSRKLVSYSMGAF